jgi:hypothetical protein
LLGLSLFELVAFSDEKDLRIWLVVNSNQMKG